MAMDRAAHKKMALGIASEMTRFLSDAKGRSIKAKHKARTHKPLDVDKHNGMEDGEYPDDGKDIFERMSEENRGNKDDEAEESDTPKPKRKGAKLPPFSKKG